MGTQQPPHRPCTMLRQSWVHQSYYSTLGKPRHVLSPAKVLRG